MGAAPAGAVHTRRRPRRCSSPQRGSNLATWQFGTCSLWRRPLLAFRGRERAGVARPSAPRAPTALVAASAAGVLLCLHGPCTLAAYQLREQCAIIRVDRRGRHPDELQPAVWHDTTR